MAEYIKRRLSGQKILILGFGREGRSTFRFIRKILPGYPLAIADINERIPSELRDEFDFTHVSFHCGPGYLNHLGDYDLIIKSPGINLSGWAGFLPHSKLSSQTDLFLAGNSARTIGITGSKGKSTTTSLIHHVLSAHFSEVAMAGNIGIPPLDIIHEITPQSWIVFEMSSHQIENVHTSPHIAVLLNLFEEHLDYYKTFEVYQRAKFNIALHQKPSDYFVYNNENENIMRFINERNVASVHVPYGLPPAGKPGACLDNGKILFIPVNGIASDFDFSQRACLPGDHNLRNITAAVSVARILNVPDEVIRRAIPVFKGLPHRLEFVGNSGGVDFYDDAIATIPEAVMEAV
ncbi:MAG: UDP-N-acetylmuramoyl-L-alanine--D-glutamate ligase, partial [Bacteroidales bacterium]|nr:UDP-N-acetylmuramoyl-L-alanine--D-glutamate ligase [Bacteroidales bacterium]